MKYSKTIESTDTRWNKAKTCGHRRPDPQQISRTGRGRKTFIKDIEKAFIRTGKIHLIKGGEKCDELQAERTDQQENTSKSIMKKCRLEFGVYYMLQSTINSIVDI
ncbi:MAG: hypothetical protein ACMUEM_01035 [Flavobacteriales bacterium AspAUS03]